MRHLNNTCKLNRTSSHRRCMFANMLKALVTHERIETTLPKAKALRSHAEKLITLAKKNTLASKRQAIAQMMVRFNPLTAKEAREVRDGNHSAANDDRFVMQRLEGLGTRFASRNGGYTRIIKSSRRVGDNAQTCIIEYLQD